jgi:hypothetical protein
MVSMVALSAVDLRFEPQSSQTKDNKKEGICCIKEKEQSG